MILHLVVDLRRREPIAVVAGPEERAVAEATAVAEAAPRLAAFIEPMQRLTAETALHEPSHLARRFVAAVDTRCAGAERFNGEAQHPGLQFGERRLDRRRPRRQRVFAVTAVAVR